MIEFVVIIPVGILCLTYCFVKSCSQVERSRCSDIDVCYGCLKCKRSSELNLDSDCVEMDNIEKIIKT